MTKMTDELHEKIMNAMRFYIPWDLRERMEGPLNGMAAAAYNVMQRNAK